MSLSTNTTYRVLVEKLGAADPGEFIGNEGELFYDPSTPAIYLSDGSTAGGLEIAGGGGTNTNLNDFDLSFVGIGTTITTTGQFVVETYQNLGVTSETRKVEISSIDSNGKLIYPPSFSYIKIENEENNSSLTIIPKVIQNIPMEYRGFSAGINKIYGNDPAINQLIIHKTDSDVYYYSNGRTDKEEFSAFELDNSDIVATVVFYTRDYEEASPKSRLGYSMRIFNDFFRSFVDNVLYTNSGIGTIGDISTNFDNNIGILTSVLPPLYPNFQFFTGGGSTWPDSSIGDGGDDQYDGGNKIVTNLSFVQENDDDIDNNNSISYNNGQISVGTSYFGGGNYVTKYANSVFAMVSVGSSIKTLGFAGNLGSDGNPVPEMSSPLFDTTKYTIENFEIVETAGSWISSENYKVSIDFSKEESLTVDNFNNFFTPISGNSRLRENAYDSITNNILIGQNVGEFSLGYSVNNVFLGKNAGRGIPGQIQNFTITSSTILAGEANNTYTGKFAKGGSGRLAYFRITRDENGDVSFITFDSNSGLGEDRGRGFGYRSGDVLTISGSEVGGTDGDDDITLTVDNIYATSSSKCDNIYIGDSAGKGNNSGSSNVFLGRYAGVKSSSGRSIFIGENTGVFSSGSYNNFFGNQAGYCNTTGSNNNFLGCNTGCSNTTGCYNNFLGSSAGRNSTEGNYNNFFGFCAGFYNTTGCYNNFFGRSAGGNNTTGCYNNFFGKFAGYSNTEGIHNNIFGREAGYCNTTGSDNNFFGNNAGRYNTTGCYNNFFGNNAGSSNTEGSHNIFFGLNAGYSNTTGCYNNFFGNNAGCSNTTGCRNNFFGRYAGSYNTEGSCNTFIGNNAGRYNTTGCSNNFFGNGAGCSNTTGSYNNFLGSLAGSYNTTGGSNNFFGIAAGRYNTEGCRNNFIGCNAGYCNTTGSDNNFLGYSAGCFNTTGTYNTFLGAYSGISTSASNKILLGRGGAYNQLFDAPDTTKSTQFAVGIRTDSNPANYWLVGNENFNVGIGTTNPTSKLTVQSGDIRVGINTSQGVILTDANGVAWRLIVNTNGTLTTVAV